MTGGPTFGETKTPSALSLTAYLDGVQRKVLLRVYRSEGEAREARRAHVLLLLDDGLSLRQVRAITYASSDLINGCIQRFRKGGVTAAIEVEHNTSDEPFCLPQVAQ